MPPRLATLCLSPLLVAATLFAGAPLLSGCDARATPITTPEDAGTTGLPDGGKPARACGDGTCDSIRGENCTNCPADCGACPACPYAPACSGSFPAPQSTSPEPDLDLPTPGAKPDGGVIDPAACNSPKLRIGLAHFKPLKGAGEHYCVINASDGISSEVVLTPKTGPLTNGQDFAFAPGAVLAWGQGGPHATSNNLTITFNCFLVVSDQWSQALMAAGNVAAMLGGIAGQDGWAFGVADVGAQAASAALGATDGDQYKMNVEQTIPKEALLGLANGKSWTVEQSGSGFDWQLTVDAWGCALGKGQ